MTHSQAISLVEEFVVKVQQKGLPGIVVNAVPADIAKSILSDQSYLKLKNDEVRRVGPTPNTIYPYNVVYYLARE